MAFGGVTTHLDFCWVHPGAAIADAVAERAARWRGRSHVDHSFHVGLLGPQPLNVFDQVSGAIADGLPSFKVFTNNVLPPHPKRRPAKLDAGRLALLMEAAARHGGLVAVHAEDDEIVQLGYERMRADGHMAPRYMPLVHSRVSERLAFARTVALAAATGAAAYFVHTSAREGVEAIAGARANGLPVYGETLHGYLCHDAAEYERPEGLLHHTYPSLKDAEDREALWSGLLDGTLSTTATDELPTTLAVKLRGLSIEDVTGGNLGAEARLGIVYTEAVAKRGMSLERFAAVTSTNAARIFGLHPRKGAIAVGSDADLAVIDPSVRRRLGREDFHVADYSPWEGWEVRGWPVATVLRGKVIAERGRLLGSLTDGALVRRSIAQDVLRGPAC